MTWRSLWWHHKRPRDVCSASDQMGRWDFCCQLGAQALGPAPHQPAARWHSSGGRQGLAGGRAAHRPGAWWGRWPAHTPGVSVGTLQAAATSRSAWPLTCAVAHVQLHLVTTPRTQPLAPHPCAQLTVHAVLHAPDRLCDRHKRMRHGWGSAFRLECGGAAINAWMDSTEWWRPNTM